jgi:glycosyltransferase involved in cell wall biosynthesis
MKLAYIVPTKDRMDDMRTLLKSLTRQTRTCDQIIIVDGSDPPIESIVAEFPSLPIDYIYVSPPSLASQRNAGVEALQDNIELVGFLDDDLVLEDTATEKMVEFWMKTSPETGGAGFSILNQPIATANRLASIFLIDDPQPGRLLPSSFQSQIPPLSHLTETQWLYGGATVWKRAILDDFRYDDWYIGHGYLEDVDFSHRVNQKYRLFVVGEAQVNHYTRPVRPSAQIMVGRQQIVNRSYFKAKFEHFSAFAFAWALLGQLLLNLGSSATRRDLNGIRRFVGNIYGLFDLWAGRRSRIGGYYK